jgi:hypothetical protein
LRCYVCDYCNTEAKSIFNFSLVDPKGGKGRYVFYDKESDREICTYCYEPPRQVEFGKEKK